MKLSMIAIFGAVLICTGALAQPTGIILGYQDALGQYSFGYSGPHQARSEVRSLDGVTRGSYSYVDGAGLVQSTDYTADGVNGFRVAATNLPQAPVPVQETPEVAAARAAHLLAVEEAEKGVQNQQLESDSVTVDSKSAKSAEIPITEVNPSPQTAEPIIEAVAEAEEPAVEVQSKEAIAEAAAAAAGEEVAKPGVQEQKGRAIEEPAVAPWVQSPAASLPVPLIPVNFDLPAISAYSSRPDGAKADETLPQSTSAQGVITPAGTTLKTLPATQVVAIAPQISLTSESSPISPDPASGSSSAREFAHYERARAVYAPVGPVNVIPVGYEPTVSSFLRYAPIPYVTYNVW